MAIKQQIYGMAGKYYTVPACQRLYLTPVCWPLDRYSYQSSKAYKSVVSSQPHIITPPPLAVCFLMRWNVLDGNPWRLFSGLFYVLEYLIEVSIVSAPGVANPIITPVLCLLCFLKPPSNILFSHSFMGVFRKEACGW